jgi:hypothetical protein
MAGGKAAFGYQLWWALDGGVLALVPGTTNLQEPELSRAMLDDTTHDSPGGWEESIPSGVINSGEVTLEINRDPGSVADLAFRSALVSGALLDLKIVQPGAAPRKNLLFSGYLSGYAPSRSETTGKIVNMLTVKPSGPITPGVEAV